MCEVSSLYVKRKSSYRAETVKRLKSKFDLDLCPFDPKFNRGAPQVMVITCMPQGNELSRRNGKKFEVQIWPWPLDPKINRGPPWVMINTCVKYHIIACFISRGIISIPSLKSIVLSVLHSPVRGCTSLGNTNILTDRYVQSNTRAA